jgi:uncharacterized RDD family membrane protein YckC
MNGTTARKIFYSILALLVVLAVVNLIWAIVVMDGLIIGLGIFLVITTILYALGWVAYIQKFGTRFDDNGD